MYCPKCHAEYIPGFTRCADCNVALVEELPARPKRAREAKPADPPRPDLPPCDELELVTVLVSGDPGLIAVAKSLLGAAEIPFAVQGDGVQDLVGIGRITNAFNVMTGPAKLQVAAQDADDARELLADLIADQGT